MASQEKVNRTDTQWRERSTMWGRDSHNLVDGVFAQLLASWTSRNRKSYNGEHRMLYDIPDDDENIEYWLGGRWGEEGEFGTPGLGVTDLQGHKGIAVATDRRVLLLNKGKITNNVVELPYQNIENVEFNDGMVSSGVKLRGHFIKEYDFYFDHLGKADVMGRAELLVDCIQGHLTGSP